MMTEPSVEYLWNDFVKHTKVSQRPELKEVFAFGAGEEMADELLELVLQGKKRATASAYWEYEHFDEPLPKVGDYSIVTDAEGVAGCIIQTISVSIRPFNQVTESFAAREGEGDGSLKYWREAHQEFWEKALKEIDRSFEETMPVVCEEFQVVHTAKEPT